MLRARGIRRRLFSTGCQEESRVGNAGCGMMKCRYKHLSVRVCARIHVAGHVSNSSYDMCACKRLWTQVVMRLSGALGICKCEDEARLTD
jgi:hypothetical protein